MNILNVLSEAQPKKLVYIRGPFRGKNPWEVKLNVDRAEYYSKIIWELRHVPICPHKQSENFDKLLPDEVFLYGTAKMLTMCDYCLAIPGWENSEGSMIESEICKELNIPEFLVNEKDSEMILKEKLLTWFEQQEDA